MSPSVWRKKLGQLKPNPKCIFCEIQTQPAVVFRGDEYIIRGWRCPMCGFTIIHPNDIQQALEVLKETAEVWKR